ncbi:MAG: ABC transporter permease [Lachnospiraceae bacterium]|jgi:NitT/TauT family transport system permease protein|nr:ABC transporter permease [Lachnospiraceae bacterium]
MGNQHIAAAAGLSLPVAPAKEQVNVPVLAGRIRRVWTKVINTAHRLLAVILFFALWELASRLKVVNPIFFPPISKIVVALWNQLLLYAPKAGMNGLQRGLAYNLAYSIKRALSGYFLGLGIAIPLGIAIGWFRRFEKFIDPLMQMFRNISVLALMPVFVMLLGIGEASRIAIIFWGVMWGNLMNTIGGVKNIDAQLVKAATVMGMPKWQLFLKVVFPGALPSIFVGIRISATTSIMVLTGAEMIGATEGLGWSVRQFQTYMMYPEMYANIIVMTVLGITINYSLAALEKRVFGWREKVGVGD